MRCQVYWGKTVDDLEVIVFVDGDESYELVVEEGIVVLVGFFVLAFLFSVH